MKKLLTLLLTLLLLNVFVVYAQDIDIGSTAMNRLEIVTNNWTAVDKNNPANASGTITSVEVYADVTMNNAQVATFYVVSGNNLSTRDSETIGTVTAGGKRTFTVNLDVESGDYIGIYTDNGHLDRTASGTGEWLKSGDNIPCTNATFSSYSNQTLSIYGTGYTPSGWGGKFNTVEIGKWNTVEISKWNTTE